MPNLVDVSITALYAGILGLMSIAIALAAGAARGRTGISIGDGGNADVVTAMRRHANFVEFVPLSLILLALLELGGAPDGAVHGLGAGLVVARACHAIGFGAEGARGQLRTVGALGSTLVVVIASIWTLTLAF